MSMLSIELMMVMSNHWTGLLDLVFYITWLQPNQCAVLGYIELLCVVVSCTSLSQGGVHASLEYHMTVFIMSQLSTLNLHSSSSMLIFTWGSILIWQIYLQVRNMIFCTWACPTPPPPPHTHIQSEVAQLQCSSTIKRM